MSEQTTTGDLPEPAAPTEVHVHNNLDANAHAWRVLSTILLIGGLVSLAWGLAQAGLLEMAASGTAAVVSMLVQLLMRNGLIVIPESRSDDARIEDGKNAIRSIAGMVRAYLDHSSILRLALISVAYGALFILLRAGIHAALGIFSNIFIAGAAGAVAASVICFPTLLAGLLRAFRSTGTKGGDRA